MKANWSIFTKPESNTSFPVSLFLSIWTAFSCLFFCTFGFTLASLQAQSQEVSTAFPYVVTGPSAPNALQLQLIDFEFESIEQLETAYIYIKDPDSGGANDLLNSSDETWVLYAIIDPAQGNLMSQNPRIADNLSVWASADYKSSLRMAGNATADGKSLLLKKLSLSDALKSFDGHYRVRFMALALEGDGINRFGLSVTDQPSNTERNLSQVIRLPFQNIWSSIKGIYQWSHPLANTENGRASIFFGPFLEDEQVQLEFRKTSSEAWQVMQMMRVRDRFVGALQLANSEAYHFKYSTIQQNISNRGIRFYMAENGSFLSSNGLSINAEKAVFNPIKKTTPPENQPSEQEEDQRPSPITNDLVAEDIFELTSASNPNNCDQIYLQIRLKQGYTNARIQSIQWLENDVKANGLSNATFTFLPNQRSKEVRFKVNLILNNELKSFSTQKVIRKNDLPDAELGINRFAAVNEILTFDGTLSSDSDGRIKEYFWDFGDGVTASGARVEHRFKASGQYKVSLTVIDNSAQSCGVDTDSIYVTINEPPTLIIQPKLSFKQGINEFNAGESYDADGTIKEILWYSGKDKIAEGVSVRLNLDENSPPIRVVAVDNSNSSNNQSELFIYPENKSVGGVLIDAPTTVSPGSGISLTAKEKDENTLFTQFNWLINGTSFTGRRIRYVFDKAGTYTVELEATNSDGFKFTDQMKIRVNKAPLIKMNIEQISGLSLSMNANGSYDPENQELRYQWSMGDGTTYQNKSIKHTYSNAGTYTIRLEVSDPTQASNSRSVKTQEISIGGSVQAQTESPVVSEEIGEVAPDIKPIPNVETKNNFAPTTATIEGPMTVFIGQRANFELVTRDQTNAVYWDLGNGIAKEGSHLSTRFEEAGKYQIMAIYFTAENGQTQQQYLTTEIEVISRQRDESLLESIYEQNRRLIGSRSIQLVLNTNSELRDILTRKTDQFKLHPNSHRSDYSKDERLSWRRFSGICEDEQYDLAAFFGIPPEMIDEERFFVFFDGKWILPYELRKQAVQMSQVVGYRLRLYQPGAEELTSDQSIIFEHPIQVNGAPTIRATVPKTMQVGEWATFSGANTTDPEGDALRFYWDTGDGIRLSGKSIRHAYVHSGTYTLKLEVESGTANSPCSRVTKEWEIVVNE